MNPISGTQWSHLNYTIPAGVSASNIRVLFNNGNGDQTVDLSRSTSGWFITTGVVNGKRTGQWTANCTTDCPIQNRSMMRAETVDKVRLGDNFTTIAPNPINATSQLTLSVNHSGVLDVIISDMNGHLVTSINQKIKSGYHALPINTEKFLKSGLYFCSVLLDGKMIKNIKLIKK